MSRKNGRGRDALYSASLLVGTVVLGITAAWLLSVPLLGAAGMLPAPSTFDSPLGNPQLAITKHANLAAPEAGDVLVYTLAYSNTVPGSQAFNVRLYDLLPAGVQFISASPAPVSFDGQVLLFTAPSVGPETTEHQVTVRVRVLDGYAQLVNYAVVTADGITPTYAALSTPVTPPPPWLLLAQDGYSVVLTNQELVYTLSCENSSAVTVDEVTVVDVLPGGVTLIDAEPSPDVSTPPTLRWTVGSLAPGAVWRAVITATAPSSAGEITNVALADGQQRLMTQTMWSTEVMTQAAILRVDKTASTTEVDLGDELVYTIHYWNDGNGPASAVLLTDTLPAGWTVGATSHPPSSVLSGQLVWQLDVLEPGETDTLVVTATVGGYGGRTAINAVDIAAAPDAFGDHAEAETWVRYLWLYLPRVLRNGG